MLLLALLGVSAEQIAADYALSAERLRPRFAARGEQDPGPALEAFLAARGTIAAEVIGATLAELDAERRLLAAGLTDADVAALRARALEA